MSTLKKNLHKYSLPIISGFLIGTTYIPFFPWALAFCLVPLWIFWIRHKNDIKTLLIGSWITQFILNLIGFHWVSHTAAEFGGFPRPIAFIVLILFATIAHLYFPISAALWSFLQKRSRSTLSLLLIPLTFALCESFYPTIFFWHLGYPWLWIELPGSQLAEWVGFYGLNLITLFMNLGVLIFVQQRKWQPIASTILLFALANSLGWFLQKRFVEGADELDVLVVQGNIGNSVKLQQEKGSYFHNFILQQFVSSTQKGLEEHPEVDLVIWPETAFPSLLNEPPRRAFGLQQRLQDFVREFKRPLLTGAYQEHPESREVYNSLVLINQEGEFIKSYHKTYLLAFGEYFPGASLLPQLYDWFPMVSHFGRGSGPTVLPVNKDLHVGAQICYESLFDDFSSSIFHQGANLIVNVTNDSWFGNDFEPYQHLYMTLARAIEFRIPLIRSTNTGISTAISASGKIHAFSPLHEEWSGVFKVHYSKEPKPTFFSYYAGYWRWILLLLCALLGLGGRFAFKSRKS